MTIPRSPELLAFRANLRQLIASLRDVATNNRAAAHTRAATAVENARFRSAATAYDIAAAKLEDVLRAHPVELTARVEDLPSGEPQLDVNSNVIGALQSIDRMLQTADERLRRVEQVIGKLTAETVTDRQLDPGVSQWRHADGTICVAGHTADMVCAEGHGKVHASQRDF